MKLSVRSFVLLGSVPLILSPAVARAQVQTLPTVDAAGAGVLRLTLAAALSRAETAAPALVIAQGLIAEAAATRVGAGIRLPENPRLSLDARPLPGRGPDRLGFAGSLEARFEVADAAGARRLEADRRVDVFRAEAAVTRLEARLLAFRGYVAFQIESLRAGHARESVAIAQRVQHATQERQAAGAGNEIETTSADLELAEARTGLSEAELAHLLAERELRFVLALPDNLPLDLTTQVTRPDPMPSADALIQMAAPARPDRKVIERRLDLLGTADVRLQREASPRVGASIGVDASPRSPVFGIVGLSIELPVAQRNQGPRAVVAAARDTERARLDLDRSYTASAIITARAAYEKRLAQLETLTAQGLPAAEQRLRLVELGWKAGRFDILRLTTVARDLVRVRDRWATTLSQLWLERLLLERLVGTALPPDHR